MTGARDDGVVVLALILAAVAGLILAGIASFGIVFAGTAVPSHSVDQPLITYDSR